MPGCVFGMRGTTGAIGRQHSDKEQNTMNKPQPAQEAIVLQTGNRQIRIIVHTPDALSVVSAAKEFGTVYEAFMHKNLYDLVVADGYDVAEVLQYLESQV
jgi:hypothetical protein